MSYLALTLSSDCLLNLKDNYYLWRDYMRLCTRKFDPKLFAFSGLQVL